MSIWETFVLLRKLEIPHSFTGLKVARHTWLEQPAVHRPTRSPCDTHKALSPLIVVVSPPPPAPLSSSVRPRCVRKVYEHC